MPIVLQEELIQWILRPLSRVTEQIPRIVRNAAVSLCIAGIIFMQFAVGSGLYTGRYLFQFAIACCLWGIVILAGLTPEIRPVRFSPVLTVCWLGVAAFMLTTGILVETDSLSGAITWLVVLPVLYLTWSGLGFDRFLPLVIRGVMISFLFFTVVSVFFYPIYGINYASFYTNRNGTGLYLTAVFVCLLCYIFTQERYSRRMLAADAAIGFAAATIYYTNCRTAIFAAAVCFLFASVLQFITHKKEWRQVVLFQLLPVIAAVILLLPTSVYLYYGGYRFSSAVQTVLAPTDTPDAPDVPAPSTFEVLEMMNDYNTARFSTEGTRPHEEDFGPVGNALNHITAGRVQVWAIYLREVHLLGHRSGTVLYDATGKELNLYAHCAIIQFAYNYGALAGVFFLLLNILAGLSSIRFAVVRQDVKYRLAPFVIAIAFGAVSVMESTVDFSTDSVSMLYFLSLAPLITVPAAGKTESDEP